MNVTVKTTTPKVEKIVLELSEVEAWALVATLGRVVTGPTDSKTGCDLYNTLFDSLFDSCFDVSDEFNNWFTNQTFEFADKRAGHPFRLA